MAFKGLDSIKATGLNLGWKAMGVVKVIVSFRSGFTLGVDLWVNALFLCLNRENQKKGGEG